MTVMCGAMIATGIVTPGIHAAPQAAAQQAAGNDAIQALEARYAARLEAMQAGVSKAILAEDEGKKAADAAARAMEKAAKAALDEARARAGELQQAEAEQAHERAIARTIMAVGDMGLDSLLTGESSTPSSRNMSS